MSYDYDIVFLGGGLNYAGAVIASRANLKVALIEQNLNHLGGTCLHNGCIPSKMYLQAAKSIYLSKKPWIDGSLKLEIKNLYEAKEQLLKDSTDAIKKQCKDVDIIEGKGFLTKPHIIEIDGKEISGEHIVIGTGSRPFIPEKIEYNGKDIITSDEILNMQSLPKKISIYGAGAIALEMASFFAAADVEVELIWRRDALLNKAHPLISKNIAKQMQKLGVKLLSEHSITFAKSTKRGVHIKFLNNKEHYTPMLLVATGRVANIDAIKCVEIEVDKKGIKTDEHFETSLAKHYAIGDCNGKIELAHAARAEVKYVVKRVLAQKARVIKLENIVKFIHTLACSYANVGKTKYELESLGIKYKESVLPIGSLPFSRTHEGEFAIIALYADEEGFIIGAEIFAPNAEELIAIVAMAIAGEMDVNLAKRTILAHPTFSESIESAFKKL